MHSRWPLFGALVAGIAAVAAIGYIMLSSNPSGEAVPASGGEYVEGVTRAPERINPLYAYANPTDQDIAALVFSGLVRLGPDGEPQPDLAERWEVIGSGASYVFHLREGVAWQDSPDQPLTSADVVFTFDTIADPDFRGDPQLAQAMEGVSVVARDAYTVEFRLEQPYAPFLAYLTVGIVPRHLLGTLDADEMFNSAFNISPVGTGPYRFGELTSDGVVLRSNPTYHFGPPHISSLRFRRYADDSALVEALRDDDIDGALLGDRASAQDLEFLADDDRFALHGLTESSLRLAYFDNTAPLFASDAVREALLLATDTQALIDGVTGGTASPAIAGIPPGSWAFADVDSPAPDLGAAARFLEIGGWSRGSDGVRANSGIRMAFTLSTPNEEDMVTLAEQLARQWRAVGADVTVLPRDAETYVDDVLLARDFEAALAEIDYGADPDSYAFWHSSQVQPPGLNVAGYQDADLDDKLERGRQTTGVERRQELYSDFTELFIEGAPAVPIYHGTSTYVQRATLQGFEAGLLFIPTSRFHNVHEWYVHTRSVD